MKKKKAVSAAKRAVHNLPILTLPVQEIEARHERRRTVSNDPTPFGARLSPVARQALTDALCAAINKRLDEKLEELLDHALEESIETARRVIRENIHKELNSLLPEMIREALTQPSGQSTTD